MPRTYDLLVFSQTVPDVAVKEIMASAVKLHPDVRFLVISEEGRQTTVRLRHIHG